MTIIIVIMMASNQVLHKGVTFMPMIDIYATAGTFSDPHA
jgi:hypothetical protein